MSKTLTHSLEILCDLISRKRLMRTSDMSLDVVRQLNTQLQIAIVPAYEWQKTIPNLKWKIAFKWSEVIVWPMKTAERDWCMPEMIFTKDWNGYAVSESEPSANQLNSTQFSCSLRENLMPHNDINDKRFINTSLPNIHSNMICIHLHSAGDALHVVLVCSSQQAQCVEHTFFEFN